MSAEDVTGETLRNRNGETIAENVVGRCINDDYDGVVLNTKDSKYNYISYRIANEMYGIKDGISVGDYILTVNVFNPNTNYEDDIIDRYDDIIECQSVADMIEGIGGI